MKIKKILLLVLVCLVIAGLASIMILNSYKKDRQTLEAAQSLLYENKADEAKALFSSLKESFWIKKQARLGSIITDILSNDEHNDVPLPEKDTINIDRYHLPSLLRRLLASSAFTRCIQLAKTGKFYEMEAADLYYSAALLENGKPGEAFRCYPGLSDRLKKTFLGNRLKETFELLHAGAHSIVRDRTGKLVGTIGEDRQFKFYRPQYRSFIQPVIIKEIINHETQKGIRLSIDLELSRLALESLGENQGSIVLIQPGTGEVLAAVSDEKTGEKMGEGSSPAFEKMLEPALAVSCNTAFADLGVKIGWEGMWAVTRYGGTAGFIAPAGFPVYMKTGTGGSYRDGYHVN